MSSLPSSLINTDNPHLWFYQKQQRIFKKWSLISISASIVLGLSLGSCKVSLNKILNTGQNNFIRTVAIFWTIWWVYSQDPSHTESPSWISLFSDWDVVLLQPFLQAVLSLFQILRAVRLTVSRHEQMHQLLSHAMVPFIHNFNSLHSMSHNSGHRHAAIFKEVHKDNTLEEK